MAIAALPALPGAASAVTRVEYEPRDQTIDVLGDGADNAIRVKGNEDGSVTVVDRRSGVVGDPERCTQLSDRAARCVGHFDVVLGLDGADEIELVPAREDPDLVESISGGNGRDLLIGGIGEDEISGDSGGDRIHAGPGADRIQGNAGSDRLWGGNGDDDISRFIDRGRDWFRAGRGNDSINAVDGRRDGEISCGPGRDRARYDAKKDPPRGGCERQTADKPSAGPPVDRRS